MRNLQDFANENKFEEKQKSNVDENYIKEKVNEYSGLSQNELMSKLLGEVNQLKTTGNFDYNKIAKMAGNVKSYLTADQQRNLDNLLKIIK